MFGQIWTTREAQTAGAGVPFTVAQPPDDAGLLLEQRGTHRSLQLIHLMKSVQEHFRLSSFQLWPPSDYVPEETFILPKLSTTLNMFILSGEFLQCQYAHN